MTVVVLGAGGMLGHVVVRVLRDAKIYTIGVARRPTSHPQDIVADALHPLALERLIAQPGVRWVVNAIGVLPRQCEQDPALAETINARLPHLLSAWGRRYGFRVIQVSTDCVFSGEVGQYTVSSAPDATDPYGRSKASGELNNDRDVTIRTSIIGPELKLDGSGLFLWFMRKMGSCEGWTGAHWTGLTSLELAHVVGAIVESDSPPSGIYQCVPDVTITKFDLLHLMADVFRRHDSISIVPVVGRKTDKSLVNNRRDFWAIPSYREMLSRQLTWMRHHAPTYRGTPFHTDP